VAVKRLSLNRLHLTHTLNDQLTRSVSVQASYNALSWLKLSIFTVICYDSADFLLFFLVTSNLSG